MARTKRIIPTGVSKKEMENAFSLYAKAEAQMDKINASIETQIAAIRDRYSSELATLKEIKDTNFDVLQAYALANKNRLFVKKKSLDSLHGTIGFRTGTPKLKTLKGFTWNAVTNLLKEFLPDYVRIAEEPAKDKLLAERNNEQIADFFPKIGVVVTQDETFFVEVKEASGFRQ
ncbi:hypothetical protein RCZ04_17090 [Capnocytophaga sp. HP1101]